MIIEKDDLLSEWIKKRITEICDAEPVAFAKYVLALLRKDSSEDKLREICEEQLNVFLGSNTTEFVDSLFDSLNNRTYLSSTITATTPLPPLAATNGGDTSENTAGTSQDSTITTSGSQSKSDSGRAAAARRRISPPRESKDDARSRDTRRRRSRSRSPAFQRRRPFNGRERYRSHSRSRSRSPHRRDYHRRERTDRNLASSTGPSTTTTKSRIRCRDFEEKGLCRRGDNCMYDHGPDPIVLDDNNAENFQPDFNANPPPPGTTVSATYVSTSTNSMPPEAYNPEAPAISTIAPTLPGGFVPNFSVPPPPIQQIAMNPMGGMMPMNAYMQQSNMFQPSGGFMRGRGRGRFGRYSGERVPVNKSTTIEVRRIPPEVNKLGIIHKHFEQFGDITNIQISFDGSPDTALVTFAKFPDAQAAMKSEKPILDNRFIHVAWHKPPPPAPPAAEIKSDQTFGGLLNVQPVIPLMAEPKSTEHIPTSLLSQAQAARRAQQAAEEKLKARRKERQMRSHNQKIHMLKTQLYEKQTNELKGVYERIAKATDPKLKKTLMVLVKKLEESRKALATEIQTLHDELQKGENKSKSDDEEASPKKRRLSSTHSAGENADDEDAKRKKEENDDEPEEHEKTEPDEQAIRKLLTQSDSEEELE